MSRLEKVVVGAGFLLGVERLLRLSTDILVPPPGHEPITDIFNATAGVLLIALCTFYTVYQTRRKS